MRIVTIDDAFITACEGLDREFMGKRGCPCALLVGFWYRGRRRTFAIPFRSNISPNTPKAQYFPLPPRKATRPRCHHGIHYIKMFPVRRRYTKPFHVQGNAFYVKLQRILDRNEAQIIAACKAYLRDFEFNGPRQYAVDIDRILAEMDAGRL